VTHQLPSHLNPQVVEGMRAVRERENEERRRSGHVWREAQPLLDALAAAGVDPTDFGAFGWASFSTFDFGQAAPIIIEWLPRVLDMNVTDAMVRSLADQPAAQGEVTRRLLRSSSARARSSRQLQVGHPKHRRHACRVGRRRCHH
jgi:hypothetical protein